MREGARVRIRQRASFVIKSNDTRPDEITRLVEIEPDETKARGSRHQVQGSPPVPRCHLWTVRSGLDDSDAIDAHLDALLVKVGPGASAFAHLVRTTDSVGVLRLVRHFEADDEGDDQLGFHLDELILAFLREADAVLDVDEYG
jgi:Domain of unknown function (DUF4279)